MSTSFAGAATAADLLACAECHDGASRIVGNVRADSIARMCREYANARAEIARLTAELAAARAVPADVEAALDTWAQSEIFAAESEYEPRDSARADANRDILRTAIARAISDATAAAVDEFIDRHAKRLCEQAGYKWSRDDEDSDGEADDWASEIHDVLSHLRADKDLTIHDGRSAARGTVGGLLATRCCSKCRGISSHTPGGIPCDECGLVGSMPWGG